MAINPTPNNGKTSTGNTSNEPPIPKGGSSSASKSGSDNSSRTPSPSGPATGTPGYPVPNANPVPEPADVNKSYTNPTDTRAHKSEVSSKTTGDDSKNVFSSSQGSYTKKHFDATDLLEKTAEIEASQFRETEAENGAKQMKHNFTQAFGIDTNNVYNVLGHQANVEKVINQCHLTKSENVLFNRVDVGYAQNVQKEIFKMTELQRQDALTTGMINYKGFYHKTSVMEQSLLHISEAQAKVTFGGNIGKRAFNNKQVHKKMSKDELHSAYSSDIAYINSRLRRKDAGEHKTEVAASLGSGYITKTTAGNALQAYRNNVKLIEKNLISRGLDVKNLGVVGITKALNDGKIGGHILSDSDRTLLKELLRLKKVEKDADRLSHHNSKGGILKTWTKEGLKDSDAQKGIDTTKQTYKTIKMAGNVAKNTGAGLARGAIDVVATPSKIKSEISSHKINKKTKLEQKAGKFEAKSQKKIAKFNKTGNSSQLKKAYKLDAKTAKYNKKAGKIDSVKWQKRGEKADLKLAGFNNAKGNVTKAVNFSPKAKIKQGLKAGAKKAGRAAGGSLLKIKPINKLWNSKYILRIRHGQTLVQKGGKVVGKAFKAVGKKSANVSKFLKKFLFALVCICGGILLGSIILTFVGRGFGDILISLGETADDVVHPFNSENRTKYTKDDPEKESGHQNGLYKGHDYFHDCFVSIIDANDLHLSLPEEGYHVTRPVQQYIKGAVGDDGIYRNMVVSKNQSGLAGDYSIVGYDFSNYKAKTIYSFPITVYDRWVPPSQEPVMGWVEEPDENGNMTLYWKQKCDSNGNPLYTTVPGYWETHQDAIDFEAYTGIHGNLGEGYSSPGLYIISPDSNIVTSNNYTEYRYNIKIDGALDSFYINMVLMGLNCTQINLDNEDFWLEYNKATINTLMNYGSYTITYETQPINKELEITYVDPVRAAKDGTKAATQKVKIPANKTIATVNIVLDDTALQKMLDHDEITNDDLHSEQFGSTGRYEVKDPSQANYFEWDGWEGNSSLITLYRDLWDGGGYDDPESQADCVRQFYEIMKTGKDSLDIPDDKGELLPCNGVIW